MFGWNRQKHCRHYVAMFTLDTFNQEHFIFAKKCRRQDVLYKGSGGKTQVQIFSDF